MDGSIRKIKLSYPFRVGEHQKIDVYSIDDMSYKHDGHKLLSIVEEIDPVNNMYVYKIYTEKNGNPSLWKAITPDNCTKELEYNLN